MKTPYAILIGLALIAVAKFFRVPSISPASALSSCQPFDGIVHIANWPMSLVVGR